MRKLTSLHWTLQPMGDWLVWWITKLPYFITNVSDYREHQSLFLDKWLMEQLRRHEGHQNWDASRWWRLAWGSCLSFTVVSHSEARIGTKLAINCYTFSCPKINYDHYSNVIISAMVSQITGASIVYSTAVSGADLGIHRWPRYWPFVRGIHQSPVNSPHKGQWRAWINRWVNNREAGHLRRHRALYDVIVMVVLALMYFVVVRYWPIYKYSSRLNHWPWRPSVFEATLKSMAE